MECVILLRKSNGKIEAIMNGDSIAIFSDMDAAVVETQKHPLCAALPWQIVECDEL